MEREREIVTDDAESVNSHPPPSSSCLPPRFFSIDKKKPYQFRTKGMAKFNGYGSENLDWDADKQKWTHPTSK